MEETKTSLLVYDSASIQKRIYTIRDVQAMLDSDLAACYGIETKVLNQAVKRNIGRFPEDFMFQLTKEEKMELVTNCERLEHLKFSSVLPKVFTEQGIAMLSGVLRSSAAIKVSVQIISAFVAMRKFIFNIAQLFQRIDTVEKRQLKHEFETDEKFEKIFNEMQIIC